MPSRYSSESTFLEDANEAKHYAAIVGHTHNHIGLAFIGITLLICAKQCPLLRFQLLQLKICYVKFAVKLSINTSIKLSLMYI